MQIDVENRQHNQRNNILPLTQPTVVHFDGQEPVVIVPNSNVLSAYNFSRVPQARRTVQGLQEVTIGNASSNTVTIPWTTLLPMHARVRQTPQGWTFQEDPTATTHTTHQAVKVYDTVGFNQQLKPETVALIPNNAGITSLELGNETYILDYHHGVWGFDVQGKSLTQAPSINGQPSNAYYDRNGTQIRVDPEGNLLVQSGAYQAFSQLPLPHIVRKYQPRTGVRVKNEMYQEVRLGPEIDTHLRDDMQQHMQEELAHLDQFRTTLSEALYMYGVNSREPDCFINPDQRFGAFVLSDGQDRGTQREGVNEDSHKIERIFVQEGTNHIDTGETLMILTDGAGGQQAGEFASVTFSEILMYHYTKLRQTIHDQLKRLPQEQQNNLIEDTLQQAIVLANNHYITYRENLGIQGAIATCAVALTRDFQNPHMQADAFLVNVGDARAYIVEKDQTRQVTKDQSYIQDLIDQGSDGQQPITEITRYSHPQRNIITKSVGENRYDIADQTTLDKNFIIHRQKLKPGDQLLLCCDGLWEETQDPDGSILHQLVTGGNQEQKLQRLIAYANFPKPPRSGGSDNVSAILATFDPYRQQPVRENILPHHRLVHSILNSLIPLPPIEKPLQTHCEEIKKQYPQGVTSVKNKLISVLENEAIPRDERIVVSSEQTFATIFDQRLFKERLQNLRGLLRQNREFYQNVQNHFLPGVSLQNLEQKLMELLSTSETQHALGFIERERAKTDLLPLHLQKYSDYMIQLFASTVYGPTETRVASTMESILRNVIAA